jgi:hypothetical protein
VPIFWCDSEPVPVVADAFDAKTSPLSTRFESR